MHENTRRPDSESSLMTRFVDKLRRLNEGGKLEDALLTFASRAITAATPDSLKRTVRPDRGFES